MSMSPVWFIMKQSRIRPTRARTLDYKSETVLRNLFVGSRESFASCSTDERREIVALANGALTFVARLEKKQRGVSDIDRSHRDVLSGFVRRTCRSEVMAMKKRPGSAHVVCYDLQSYHP